MRELGVQWLIASCLNDSYSPLSTQAVALSSDGVVPNRTSSAATVKANSTIATRTKPALTTGHVPCRRDSIVLLICLSRSKPEIKRPTVFVCQGRPAICDLEHRSTVLVLGPTVRGLSRMYGSVQMLATTFALINNKSTSYWSLV